MAVEIQKRSQKSLEDEKDSASEASDNDTNAVRSDLCGGNEGWANVFAKVLTQNPKLKKTKKNLVLVKARKDAERDKKKEQIEKTNEKGGQLKKKIKREPMKIVDEHGNVVDEEELSDDEDKEEDEAGESGEEDSSESDGEDGEKKTLTLMERQKLRRLRMELGMVTPQAGDPYEKNLLRTATKGVVQLFNAVTKFQDQRRAKRDAESSDEDDHRYKKGRFMETLSHIQEKSQKKRSEGKNKGESSKWEALREDFMMDSKMRDWDKQQSSDEEGP